MEYQLLPDVAESGLKLTPEPIRAQPSSPLHWRRKANIGAGGKITVGIFATSKDIGMTNIFELPGINRPFGLIAGQGAAFSCLAIFGHRVRTSLSPA